MFNFLKRKKVIDRENDQKNKKDVKAEKDKTIIQAVIGLTSTYSARKSIDKAAKKFEKPEKYAGNRQLYDSGQAKREAKIEAFKDHKKVVDPYTNEEIYLTKSEALLKGGKEALNNVAESDHVTPIKRIFEWNKKNPWISNEDIHDIGNSKENMQVVSRAYNNAKRSRTNQEFVTDEEYLVKTGVTLSDEAKRKAIQRGKKSEAIIGKRVRQTTVKNMFKTGHQAGMDAATNTGSVVATISTIRNITSVIKGEKSAEEAIEDTVVETGKAAAKSYMIGNGVATISHSLSSSSSQVLQTLSKSNVPAQVITAMMVAGDTLKRYGKGEISTQECLIELGDKGLSTATMGYSAMIGNAILPGVGAVVGAMVGSALTSHYYNDLMTKLQTKQLEHKERMKIIAECEQVAREARAYREELERYLDEYFAEYKACFTESISQIYSAFETGDADGVIAGANKITRKLGGNVYYETVAEFEDYLANDSVDIL